MIDSSSVYPVTLLIIVILIVFIQIRKNKIEQDQLDLEKSIKNQNIELFEDTLSDLQINILVEEEKILREKYNMKKMLD